jgi:integrase
MRDAYQQLVAARGRELAQSRGPRAGAGTRDGARAAAQLVYAARAVAKALVLANLLTSNPLQDLREPKSPGPPREKGLTDDELREYCSILLANSTDPELDALAWMLFRVLGARLVELSRIRDEDAVPSRPAVTLVGKGGRLREQPCHRPVLLLVLAAMRSRPPAANGQLLRLRSGRGFDRKYVEKWSRALHQRADWAVGFPIRVHALRHSTAQLARGHDRGGDVAAGTLLGHAGATGMRSTLIYTAASTATSMWEDRLLLTEHCFGPVDGWPALVENDILGAVLDLDLPLPPVPDGPTADHGIAS